MLCSSEIYIYIHFIHAGSLSVVLTVCFTCSDRRCWRVRGCKSTTDIADKSNGDEMGIGFYLTVVLFVLNGERSHCSWMLYDCDEPMVQNNETLARYTKIKGIKNHNVFVMYNKMAKRTEYVSLTLNQSLARKEDRECTVEEAEAAGIHAPDKPGRLVAERLGGSCDPMNLFPQNSNCFNGVWKMYERWIIDELHRNELLKFCVKLIYKNETDRRPTAIRSRSFFYKTSGYVRQMSVNNPKSKYLQCHPIPMLWDPSEEATGWWKTLGLSM